MTKRVSILELKDLPVPSGSPATAGTVQFGRLLPAQQQLLLYSPNDWEDVVHEWAHTRRSTYLQVQRFTGPGDMGIDIAGFADTQRLIGVWDNHQCKHYRAPLTPADAAAEIAKMLWHSFQKEFAPPRRYWFVAPRGCGTRLRQLLGNAPRLRQHVIDNWDAQCAEAVGAGKIALRGQFKAYVEAFDFTIFGEVSLLEMLDQLRSTPFYASRFGGGLPIRPAVTPGAYRDEERSSRYVEQLFEAYGDHVKRNIDGLGDLADRNDLAEHFHRQRESFYHAEALRNFARDTVPVGTFEELQSEVYTGVIDVEASSHTDALERLNAVTTTATGLQLTSNALISVMKVHDRKGICHQLANDNRLRWRKR